MKLLPQEIADLVAHAVQAAQAAGDLPVFDLPEFDIRPPKRPEQGDYAASVALALAKTAGMPPLEIANRIAKYLPSAVFVGSVEVVPPGYVNFRLSDAWLKQQVETIIAEGESAFALDIGAGKRAQVEFVSANPTGPLTVGRTRGGVIGDSTARVLEAAGYNVEREYYFNNAGRQMRNLGNSLRLRYLQALGREVKLPDDDSFYQGKYLIDFAHDLVKERGDVLADADWQPFKDYAEQRMFDWIKNSLARIQIRHDVFFNENSLYESGAIWKVMEELQERGYVYKAVLPEDADPEDVAENDSKGEAVWFRSTQFGDTKDRVLVKSSGEPTYTLPDIAYHANKIERGFDLMVNILGSDHLVQAQVVKYGLMALGLDPSKVRVIINQMVLVMQDGKPVRGSTRRGIFDTLDDLIDETSPDAVRYLMLARSPDSQHTFDLDLAVKQSNDNPVYYIQNAHVRCAGIFREAAARGVSDDGADVSLLSADELRFIRKALELGEVIEVAARNLEAYRVAFYAQELAQVFHPIYDSVRALHSEVPPELQKARLRFYRAAQVVFRRVLTLMGMTAPDYM
ncbi:MAG: arginine--tRNA ligase [Anaerolineae bacterium]|nr:arginine--tRNA ligase [Anaerolineae bacterium]